MSILAAVDGAERSLVIRRADELARAFDEELVVLHVVSAPETSADAEAVATAAIRLSLDDPEHVTAAGAVGDPAPRILDEAIRREASYIVLGPRERTPIAKALLGSVSQLVLSNADCTVAFVPPEG
jgi:nucleotide-binding universal stress UspA family protein